MKIALILPVLAIFSAFALFLGAVVTVNAGHSHHSMFQTNIDDMDANNDGKVSFDEYSTYHSKQLRWSFDALDTNNNSFISSDEWDMFLNMHGVGKDYDYKQEG